MTPTTLEECKREIDHLQRHELDFDELSVDAIDPTSEQVVERFFCRFRPPFLSLVHDLDLPNQKSHGAIDQSRYPRMGNTDPETTLVTEFHIFMSENATKGRKLDASLSYSKRWDKQRDAELRRLVEKTADEDAAMEERIEREIRSSTSADEEF